jgi:hypothetical protein
METLMVIIGFMGPFVLIGIIGLIFYGWIHKKA